MIEDKVFDIKKVRFCLEYKEKNPLILMIYMVFSLSFYLIIWLFLTNKDLEKIDKDFPNSKRAGIILFFLPLFLILLNYILKLIFTNLISQKLIFSFSLLALAFIIFLSLQYFYDFCSSFGKLTKSSTLTWYLFLYLGYFGFILLFFKFYWTSFLLILPMFTVPAMQDILNRKIQIIKLKNESSEFAQIGRKTEF